MSERPAEPRKSYIDVEVLQRLLKGLDFIILALGGLAITFSLAPKIPGNDALIGFFVLGLTFLSMLAMRSLGLYEIAALRHGIRAILLSIVACGASGALGYLLARLGLIDLPSHWLSTWIGLTAVHLVITRGIIT